MTLARVVLKENIYENGKLLIPSLTKIALSEAMIAGAQQITVPAATTDQIVPINNKGTIEALYIWTNSETTVLTVKINTSAALNASDIEFTGPVTALTTSNSDAVNAQTFNLLVVVS